MYDNVNILPHILMIWSLMIFAGLICMNYAWPYEYTLKQCYFLCKTCHYYIIITIRWCVLSGCVDVECHKDASVA